jgi:hypothetical protein
MGKVYMRPQCHISPNFCLPIPEDFQRNTYKKNFGRKNYLNMSFPAKNIILVSLFEVYMNEKQNTRQAQASAGYGLVFFLSAPSVPTAE